MDAAVLLMVVEVSKEKRIRCDYEGCHHGVYRRIHIVRFADGSYQCLGSACFSKLSKQANITSAKSVQFVGLGRLLTDEEREQLINNRAELLKKMLNVLPPPSSSPPPLPPSQQQTTTVVEESVANISAAQEYVNYQLLREYVKFNPHIEYSEFPKGEKYSRAVDMIHRRYRDLGLVVDYNSEQYQDEVQALIDDMIDRSH